MYSKEYYLQIEKSGKTSGGGYMTKGDAKLRKISPENLKKVVVYNNEPDGYSFYGGISVKDVRNKKFRKQLMRAGVIW